jgi:hypothetical protein
MTSITCTGFALGFAMLTCEIPATVPRAVCPPVRTWSQGFQNQIAAEIEAAPDSALAQVAVQSIGDRDIARACASAKRKKKPQK